MWFSRSVVSDSLRPHGLLCPWDFPGKNTGGVVIFFSRESPRPRDQTRVPCIVGRCLTVRATYVTPSLSLITFHALKSTLFDINTTDWASQVVLVVRIHMSMQETWDPFPSMGQEDPLEEGMATHSSLENPVDREAWRTMVHKVPKSQTQLKRLSRHTCNKTDHSRLELAWPIFSISLL